MEASSPAARNKLIRRIVGWLVALAVLGGAVYGVVLYRKKTAVVEPSYRTAKIEKGSVSAKVTATGTLSARVTVQVGTQVSGRLSQIFVDFNSQVKKGQIVAKLDPLLFQAAMARSRASLLQAKGQAAKAQANVDQALRTLERAKKLRAESLAGDSDVELAEVAWQSAKADTVVASGAVAAANAALNEAQINMGFTTITSPIDGVVLTRSVDVGQTVAASLSAPVLFTIAQDLKNIQVDTYVSEADVGKLTQGMAATFTVDAYPGQQFKGVVREVRNAATTVSSVVTYDAVLDVLNDDLKLKPGMTANVTFVYAEATDVLVVANAALRFTPPASALPAGSGSAGPAGSGRRRFGGGEGGPPGGGPPGGGGGRKRGGEAGSTRRTLWMQTADGLQPRRVEIGVTDGSKTEIKLPDFPPGSPPSQLPALKEGDEVIVESLVVEPTNKPAASPLGGGAAQPRGGPRL